MFRMVSSGVSHACTVTLNRSACSGELLPSAALRLQHAVHSIRGTCFRH
jgi:hypothetical protein